MWRWARRPSNWCAALLAAPLAAAGQVSAEELQRTLERLAAERAAAAPRFGETLLLGLRINGEARPQTVRAVRVQEGLAMPQVLWQELKLRPPALPPRMIDNELYLILSDAPGELVRWRIEELSQTLEIEAPPQAFSDQKIELDRAATQVTLPAQFGLFGNYDLQWQRRLGGDATLDGLAEIGVLTGSGDLSHLHLYRSDGGWTRLDTRWTMDRPEQLASLRLGDTIAQAGSWGRALRMGGVQWASDFTLRPGFLSFPLPTLKGEASLPSTVDVFVNNSQRLQGRVQPGPFDITDLPLVTGQGEIRTVVKDLLGREQVVVQPYYISPALLKPGLDSYSFELGWLRENYGIESNRYGRALGQVTWRRGITDRFTAEGRGEVATDQQTVGASGLWLLGDLGTLNVSAAGSRSNETDARQGWLGTLGLERQGFGWSSAVEVRRASTGFVQRGQPVSARWSGSATVSTQWQGWGLGMGMVYQGLPQRTVTDGSVSVASKLWTFNAGRGLGRWGYVGLSMLKSGDGGGTAMSVFWTLPLGDHQNISTSWQAQRGGGQPNQQQWQVQFQDNPPPGEGVGYQVQVDSGGRRQLQAQWQDRHVALNGGVANQQGRTDVRAGASGGMAWLDGSAYAGRRVDGGFAVVEVADQPNVRVTHDNQVVARTDASGRAFLPTLRGYQVNRVGVIADDLPLDADIESLDLQVTPAARRASLIRFPIGISRTATFRLVDEHGAPIPAGADLRPFGQTRSFPVGLDGRAFVAGLGAAPGPQRIEVRWPGGGCDASITLPPGDLELPELGTIICQPMATTPSSSRSPQ
ncbi:outer membrane usher protein [Roseateles sp. YR242]|uniref:fimbria/pilus outer membrane usher protein n=1 Tax=Roseateles sp. YR242 TaxID=1855305 RepID=UPI0008B3007B|nr:fimbria/pilus outer membrane usher protein [Roseateles sp. YR242]SEK61211.1 outer membrane usher protein [Roseateles sp. YR242]